MKEAIKAAEPTLSQDVQWAWACWSKTKGTIFGKWRHDLEELKSNGCRAQSCNGTCEGCSIHVQPS